MSVHEHRARLRDVALFAARLSGCTCEPDVIVGAEDGIDTARVLHDDWCLLLDAGRQWVNYRVDLGGREP